MKSAYMIALVAGFTLALPAASYAKSYNSREQHHFFRENNHFAHEGRHFVAYRRHYYQHDHSFYRRHYQHHYLHDSLRHEARELRYVVREPVRRDVREFLRHPRFDHYASARGAGMIEASYYQTGTRTASGEPFHPGALTAAHRTLPFGTRLHLTNPRNGRSVVVRVNDRGPFVPGRSLDVSRGAAVALGMIASGTAELRVARL